MLTLLTVTMLNHGGKRCKMRVGDNRLTIHTFLMLNICTFLYTMLFLMLSVKFSLNPIPIWVYNSLIVFRAAHLSMLGDNDVSTCPDHHPLKTSIYREKCGLLTMTFRIAHIPGIVPICLSLFIFNTNRVPHLSQRRSLWIVWLKTVQQRVHIKGDDTVTLNIVNVG